jgi:hypothetical protein
MARSLGPVASATYFMTCVHLVGLLQVYAYVMFAKIDQV